MQTTMIEKTLTQEWSVEGCEAKPDETPLASAPIRTALGQHNKRSTGWPWLLTLCLALTLPVGLALAQDVPENTQEPKSPQAASTSSKLPKTTKGFPKNQVLMVGTRRGKVFKVLPDGSSTLFAERVGHMQIILGKDGLSLDVVSQGISRITPTSDGTPATRENGHIIRILEGPSRLHGLVRDFDGHLWACQFMDEEKNNGVYKEIDGKLVQQDAPRIDNYYSMTIDNQGRVHLISFKAIHRREPDGSWTKLSTDPKMGSNIRNAIFDREGNMFVMASGVWKVTPDGTTSLYSDYQSDAFNQSEEFYSTHPIGLAFDANGVLYSTGEWRKRPEKAKEPPLESRLVEGHIYRHNPETGARELFAVVGLQPYFIVFRTLPTGMADHAQ